MIKNILLLGLLLLPLPAHAGWASFMAANNSIGTFTLPVGGGGFVRGIDIECDTGLNQCGGTGTSTKVVRTDTYGAYLWVTSGTCQGGNITAPCWQQLVTSASLPNGDAMNSPTACLGAVDAVSNQSCGVFELRIAPSNTNIAFMLLNGFLYKTTNLRSGAPTWNTTGFTQDAAGTLANDGVAQYGHKIAIDPANANNLIVCTQNNGCFESTNGGTTFAAITGITNASSVGMLVDFDPSSTTGGATPNFYIASNATGVYKCTGGLSSTPSCTLQSSGTSVPTTVRFMTVLADGTVYFVDGSNTNTLHVLTAGSWTALSPGAFGGLASVAIDPAHQTFATNAFITVSYQGGNVSYSQDSGTTWHPTTTGGPIRVATDVPWLAFTKECYMTAGQVAYDPAQSNTLFFSEGIGVWTTTPTTTWALGGGCGTGATNVTFTSQTKGIEQLVANWMFSPWTSGSNPILLSWDRPEFTITNINAYPSTHGVANAQANAIIGGWSGDWATGSPTTIGVVADANISPFTDESSLSSDGGQTWTNFAALPTGVPSSTNLGGMFALGGTSCAVWALPGTAGLFETSNAGAAWTAPTITGIAGSGTQQGWSRAFNINRQVAVADRVNGCTFYVYNGGANVNGSASTAGIYKGVFSAGSWTWTRAFTGNLDAFDGFNSQMRSVPGNAGDMFYTSGNQFPGPYPHTESFFECQDTAGTVACNAVSNIREVWAFGFGAAKVGGSGYPSIYIAGWANCGQTGINNCPSGASGYTWGIWRSTDHAATWNYLSGTPVNSLDAIKTLDGDANVYGRFYVGFLGSGFAYGLFN